MILGVPEQQPPCSINLAHGHALQSPERTSSPKLKANNEIYEIRTKLTKIRRAKAVVAWLSRVLIFLLVSNILARILRTRPNSKLEHHSDSRTTLANPDLSTGPVTASDLLTVPILFQSRDDVLQLASVDSKPRSTTKGHRLVFIGDIHGCINELNALLTKLEYNKEMDHIITTGDMVNKGPNSAAVLDLLRTERASCVRGNHDDKILHILSNGSSDSHRDIDDKEFAIAASLSDDQIAYLANCPVILHLGEFEGLDLVVVHAGLVPSVPLPEQVPSDVMNMRIIDTSTHQPSPKHKADGSEHWYKLWNKYQAMSASDRHIFARRQHSVDLSIKTVVYGHDAKKGLQLHKYTRGLDSKCVAGGQLTALVLSHDHGEQIFQVDCPEYVK